MDPYDIRSIQSYNESQKYESHLRQTQPKFINLAWDIYNIVYNHSKSLIFHKAVDTEAMECPDYYEVIPYPMDLETMKVIYLY